MAYKKPKGTQSITGSAYTGQVFTVMYAEILESPAFADLSAKAQALLTRLGFEYWKAYSRLRNPNGEIQLATSRIQAYLNIGERSAVAAMHELIEHGFVEIVEHQNWIQRQARKLRLTWIAMGEQSPSKDWLRWKNGQAVFEVPRHRNAKKSLDCLDGG